MPVPMPSVQQSWSAEKIRAYVAERLQELDGLISEAEKHITELSKSTTPKLRELCQWYKGVLKGLEFSKSLLKAVGIS